MRGASWEKTHPEQRGTREPDDLVNEALIPGKSEFREAVST